MAFNIRYAILSLILFVTEVMIALYVDDQFIRPYVGDYLVVILLYCGLKTFTNLSSLTAAIATLLFAYTIEAAQYFNIVDRLGLGHITIARVLIGTYFTWVDILAYTLGTLTVIAIERIRTSNSTNF